MSTAGAARSGFSSALASDLPGSAGPLLESRNMLRVVPVSFTPPTVIGLDAQLWPPTVA